jgi:uncharacterized protein involved in propanediol utilization
MVAPGMVAPVESVTLPAMSELELAWPNAKGVTTLTATIAAAAMRIARDIRRKVPDAAALIIFRLGVSAEAVVFARFSKRLFRVLAMFIVEPPKVARI